LLQIAGLAVLKKRNRGIAGINGKNRIQHSIILMPYKMYAVPVDKQGTLYWQIC
jgi:hypothetical protein